MEVLLYRSRDRGEFAINIVMLEGHKWPYVYGSVSEPKVHLRILVVFGNPRLIPPLRSRGDVWAEGTTCGNTRKR